MKEGANQYDNAPEELSHPVEHWGEEFRSYVLNTRLGEEGLEAVHRVQQALQERFPNSFVIAPDEALHITLMDWLAPLVQYEKDKDELFQEHFAHYDASLKEILSNQQPIRVRFNQVLCSPDAVIVVGEDDDSYARIRSEFLDQQELIPGTKQPPRIIHSTIARFTNSINMDDVRKVVKENPVDFTQEIDHFRLIKESRVPMLEFEEIKRYTLTGE